MKLFLAIVSLIGSQAMACDWASLVQDANEQINQVAKGEGAKEYSVEPLIDPYTDSAYPYAFVNSHGVLNLGYVQIDATHCTVVLKNMGTARPKAVN